VSEAVDEGARRTRGRPRLAIDRQAAADAVAELYGAGGYEGVTILGVAEILGVSRATLYRAGTSKDELIEILFDRCAGDLSERTKAAIADADDPATRLTAMIRVHADAAVRMRDYLELVVGGVGLPPDLRRRWRAWSRQIERRWITAVSDCMADNHLDTGDPELTARLILGMVVSAARWSDPRDTTTGDTITAATVGLIGLARAG
jgi:AcrR family transcriptional regulator